MLHKRLQKKPHLLYYIIVEITIGDFGENEHKEEKDFNFRRR